KNGWDGLVTNDGNMLREAKTMDALGRTTLALVIAVASGHNPLKATGLLLAYLDAVALQVSSTKAQIFELRAQPVVARPPGRSLEVLAEHSKLTVEELVKQKGLTDAELGEPLPAFSPPAPLVTS